MNPLLKMGKKQVLCGLALVCLLGAAAPLAAQDFHVYYNLFNDSITYEKDGKPVSKPTIRKGDFIVLHFTEYNPYLYNAEVDIEQSNSEDWDGGNSAGQAGSAGLMNMLTPFLGGGGAAGPLSIMDMPLLSLGQTSIKLSDLFANKRGADQILAEAKVKLQALNHIQAEMVEIQEEIQTLQKAEQFARLAIKQLDQVVTNPRIRPSKLREIAQDYQSLIFPDKTAGSLRLDDVYQWQERGKAKQKLLLALSEKQSEFDAVMTELDPVSRSLSNLDLGNAEFDRFAAELGAVVRKSGSLRAQMNEYITTIQKEETLALEVMVNLQMKLRELAEQAFSYPVAISVEKNTVVVNGRFIPIQTGEGAEALKTIRKTLKLTATGGLRISSGFGLAFSRLSDPVEDFTVRNNTIVAEEGGFAQPSLATFIHFYPNTRRSVAFAGAFGVGLPLSAGGISSLSFFLGPSLIFGRGQRIALTGGLNASPVKRLAKGFQIGDSFDPANGDIPTRSKYELGYFVGLSFNIGG